MNFDYQDTLLALLGDLSAFAGPGGQQMVAFRRVLRDGLVEFYNAGGMSDPQIEMASRNFARALMAVSDPGDVEVAGLLAEVGYLLATPRAEPGRDELDLAALAEWSGLSVEAICRVFENDSETFRAQLRQFTQGIVGSDFYAALESAFTSATDAALTAARDFAIQAEWGEVAPLVVSVSHDQTSTRPSSGPAGHRALREWLEDLRRVVRNAGPKATDIQRVAKPLRQGFGDLALDEQAMHALLAAYRRILESRSPSPAKEVVSAIDDDLVRVGRLELANHKTRKLWAQAAASLGQRASSDMRRVLGLRSASEQDPQVAKTLKLAQAKTQPGRLSEEENKR